MFYVFPVAHEFSIEEEFGVSPSPTDSIEEELRIFPSCRACVQASDFRDYYSIAIPRMCQKLWKNHSVIEDYTYILDIIKQKVKAQRGYPGSSQTGTYPPHSLTRSLTHACLFLDLFSPTFRISCLIIFSPVHNFKTRFSSMTSLS